LVAPNVTAWLGISVLWLKPRQVLLLCAGLDLLGVVGVAALLDRFDGTDLLRHPNWWLPFGLVYIALSWLFSLPETFTLGHRRVQLVLLSGLSLWALVVRLLLWRLARARHSHGLSLLELAERQQQRLLPAHLPEQALCFADLPWSDPLSVQRQLKRSADISLALTLLVVTLPLLLVAGLLIWLEERGPVFFVQDRTRRVPAPGAAR
jgi:hypothetical protein